MYIFVYVFIYVFVYLFVYEFVYVFVNVVFPLAGYDLGHGVLRDPGMTVAPPDKFDNFTCGRIDLMGDIVTK